METAGLSPELAAALRQVVDDYRAWCLWFLRPDYCPTNTTEALRVLRYVEQHGDVAALRRAGVLRQWLLHPTSATSANSSP